MSELTQFEAAARAQARFLDSMSREAREQLADLCKLVQELDQVRAGSYMYLSTELSLDSEYRPVVVIEEGSAELGSIARRVITLASLAGAREYVTQETFYYALRASKGFVAAESWRKTMPEPEIISDETEDLRGAPMPGSYSTARGLELSLQ